MYEPHTTNFCSTLEFLLVHTHTHSSSNNLIEKKHSFFRYQNHLAKKIENRCKNGTLEYFWPCTSFEMYFLEIFTTLL